MLVILGVGVRGVASRFENVAKAGEEEAKKRADDERQKREAREKSERERWAKEEKERQEQYKKQEDEEAAREAAAAPPQAPARQSYQQVRLLICSIILSLTGCVYKYFLLVYESSSFHFKFNTITGKINSHKHQL